MTRPTKPAHRQHTRSSKRRYHKKTGNKHSANPSNLNESIEFVIDNLLHDGRGVATYQSLPQKSLSHASQNHSNDKLDNNGKNDKQGKKVFVSFALPGETVKVRITNHRKSFEEGDCITVIDNPNPQRNQPVCQHFAHCGGCSLQHWQPNEQIAHKQSVLAEHLEHQAQVKPDNWLSPIVGNQLGYRSKARLGVRYLAKQDKLIIGFRERNSNRLVHIRDCPILDRQLNDKLNPLTQLIKQLEGRTHISHLELAVGEPAFDSPTVAMVIRHLNPLSDKDIRALIDFSNQHHWQLYSQPNKSSDTIQRIDGNHSTSLHAENTQTNTRSKSKLEYQPRPHQHTHQPLGKLYYRLPYFNLTFAFFPTDFTQVNYSVNQQMTKLACDLLALKKGERVLDLFSGLGNFSLVLARLVGGDQGNEGLVVGIEGSAEMTARAKQNAKLNELYNTEFYTQDLTQDLSKAEWAQLTDECQQHNTSNHNENSPSINQKKAKFDAIVIDPPRSGAWEVMQYLPNFGAKRIVYVSCNPATLARDSKILIEHGYHLTDAGVMDMFCHTSHVESIAHFEKR